MKTRLLATVSLLISIAFVGCNPEKAVETGPDDIQRILGNWRLLKPSPTFGTTLAVEIDQYSGGTASGIYSLKLTGKAAVNSYFTSARLINWATGDVELETVGTTKIGGPTDVMQFEQTYYTNLKAVNRYELTNKNRLTFYYPDGVFVYEKTN